MKSDLKTLMMEEDHVNQATMPIFGKLGEPHFEPCLGGRALAPGASSPSEGRADKIARCASKVAGDRGSMDAPTPVTVSGVFSRFHIY